MEDADYDNYTRTSADDKRPSATTGMDWWRFGAMRSFDDLRLSNALKGVGNSHLVSSEEYALLISKSNRKVLPNPLKNPEAEKNKRKKMEAEKYKTKTETKKMEAECESEKNKRKKMEGEDGEVESPKNKKKAACDGESTNNPSNKLFYGNDLTTKSQPEKFKAFIEEVIRMRRLIANLGPEGAEAVAKAQLDAVEAAKAAGKSLEEAKAEGKAKAREAEAREEAAAKTRQEAQAKAYEEVQAKALIDPKQAAVEAAEAKLQALIAQAKAAAKVLDEAKQALHEAKEAPAKVRRSTRISRKVACYSRPLLV